MKRYSLTVRGARKTWAFTIRARSEHVEDWRADGLEADDLIATYPATEAEVEAARVSAAKPAEDVN